MIRKDDLSRWVRKNTLLTKKECDKVLDLLFQKILDEVSNGNEVSIINFGSFLPYNHKPRPVRNLVTGNGMTLTAHRTMKFKIARTARAYIKENSE